jgi:hypothetical protein
MGVKPEVQSSNGKGRNPNAQEWKGSQTSVSSAGGTTRQQSASPAPTLNAGAAQFVFPSAPSPPPPSPRTNLFTNTRYSFAPTCTHMHTHARCRAVLLWRNDRTLIPPSPSNSSFQFSPYQARARNRTIAVTRYQSCNTASIMGEC